MIKKDVLRTLQPAKAAAPVSYKILLPLVVVLGFALRFISLGSESLTFDEVYSVKLAQMSFSEIIAQTSRDFHPPLYYFLLHIWSAVFGYGETAVRTLSVVLGTLSIWAVYSLARYIFDEKTGLIAAALLALSHMNILASQDARMYSLLVFLSVLSMHLLLRILNSYSKGIWVLYIVVNILLLHTHVYSFFILGAEVFYFFSLAFYSKRKFQENLLPFVSSYSIIIFLFVPWFFVFYKQFILAQKILWIPRATLLELAETLVEFSGSLGLSVLMLPLLFMSVILVSRVLKVNALGKFAGSFEDTEFRISFSGINEVYFLFIWLSLPVLLPFLLSQFLSPIFMAKYTIASSPAFLILSAKGLSNISSRIMKISLIFLISGLSVFNWANDLTTTNKETWREAVQYLDNQTKEGDVIVFSSGDCRYMYEYYSKKTDIPLYPFDPEQSQLRQDSLQKLLSPIYRNHKSVWLVFSHNYDLNKEIPQTLKQAADSSFSKYFYSNYRKYFMYNIYADKSSDFILLRQYNSAEIKLYYFKFR